MRLFVFEKGTNMSYEKDKCDCCLECSDDNCTECEEDELYVITPKGLAALCMIQCGLVDGFSDPRIEGFWTLFEHGMKNAGFKMTDFQDKIGKNSE